MAHLRLFGPARQAAGTSMEELPGESVADVLAEARQRFGSDFSEVLDRSKIWLNGIPVTLDTCVADADELAVIPPVSGG